MNINASSMEWDCCVIGNGVLPLWLCHGLWSAKKSVLWITSEEPYSSDRAFLQHAWLWAAEREPALKLAQVLRGFHPEHISDFELAYYDARVSKRFRNLADVKFEWGDHEKSYFEALPTSERINLWQWHQRIHAFHETGSRQSGPTQVELFNDPRLVRIQAWPLDEIKVKVQEETGEWGIDAVVLVGANVKSGPIEIHAKQFFIGDFDEYLPALIKNPEASGLLANALKGRAYKSGFGLKLWHKELEQAPSQTLVIPLTVNPEKGEAHHVVGRFIKSDSGELESYWVGLLSDEELEDNNEILKKIKQSKRAIERAIPGFNESILREAVTFEPRMAAVDLVKKRVNQALGAHLFSDHMRADLAVKRALGIFEETLGDLSKAAEMNTGEGSKGVELSHA